MGQVHTQDPVAAKEWKVQRTGASCLPYASHLDGPLPVFHDRAMAPRVLVAEDDDDLRTLMRAFLESEGYRVIACQDGLRALEALQRLQSIDLMISDVQMPGMTGDCLAINISGMRPTLPVILMSGSELSQSLRSLIREKGWIFLTKPFPFTEMLGAIHDITDRATRRFSVASSSI